MSNIDTPRPFDFHRNLRRWDLNLLVTFDALRAAEGNVTRAAERLSVSQSAMSHSLGRLRETFGDELFIRVGARMVATDFTIKIGPMVSAWLDATDRLLLTTAPFDLKRSQARLVVALPEQIEQRVMPALLKNLSRVAPEIEIYAVPHSLRDALTALDDGKIDIAVVIGEVPEKTWRISEPVTQTSYVQIYCHRLLGGPQPLPLDRIASLPHLIVSYAGRNSVVDKYLENHGLTRRVIAACAGMASIPQLIASRPMVAILPALVADPFAHDSDLAIEPFGCGKLSVPVQVVWHRRSDGDEVHTYIRRCLAKYLKVR